MNRLAAVSAAWFFSFITGEASHWAPARRPGDSKDFSSKVHRQAYNQRFLKSFSFLNNQLQADAQRKVRLLPAERLNGPNDSRSAVRISRFEAQGGIIFCISPAVKLEILVTGEDAASQTSKCGKTAGKYAKIDSAPGAARLYKHCLVLFLTFVLNGEIPKQTSSHKSLKPFLGRQKVCLKSIAELV